MKSHTNLASKCKKNAFKLISDPCIWSRAHNLPSDAFERSASSIFAANISFWQILWKSQCCVSKQGRDKMVRFVKTTCKLWFREPVPEKNTFCGFWPNRTLPYFPLSSVLRPSVLRHRRDISTFLYILTVYTMKTIYFLNAYHLGW